MFKKKLASLLIMSLALSFLTTLTPATLVTATAAYGNLDPSYGGNNSGYNFLQPNVTVNSFNIEFSVINSSILDLQGRLIVAGYVGYDDGDQTAFAIARFLTDGTLDTSFGPNLQGFNIISINDDEIFNSVKLQSNGRIIAVGSYRDSSTSLLSWIVAGFDSNGLLDPTFGGSGTGFESTTAFTTSYATSLTITSNDEIIVAGSSEAGLGISYATIAKYDSDGVAISSFGEYGIGYETITVAGTINAFNGISLTGTGNIIAVGFTNNGGPDQLLIASFTANGIPVLSFGGGNNGYNTTTISSSSTSFKAVTALANGKIIAVGSRDSSQYALLARYNPNGSLDNTFGPNNDGFLAFQIYSEQGINSLLLDGDQHILVGGTTRNGSSENWFFVGRFDLDGAADSSFGNSGIVKLNISDADGVTSLNKNANGDIIFAGYSLFLNESEESFAVGRLRGAPAPATSPQQTSIPDPVQQSIIESLTVTGETTTSIVLTGRFPESIVNILVNQSPIAPAAWVQTPVTVTIPNVEPGNYAVQIFNGAAPILPEQKVAVSKIATPAIVLTPEVTITPSPAIKEEIPLPAMAPVALPSLKIYFAMASDKLEETSQAAIHIWFEEAGMNSKKLNITGYAQATPKGASLDPALSARRARAVKNFFIKLGYTGKFQTSGAGRTTRNKAQSRYVEVLVP